MSGTKKSLACALIAGFLLTANCGGGGGDAIITPREKAAVLEELNLSTRFTPDLEDESIAGARFDAHEKAIEHCNSGMPGIDEKSWGGGIEPWCIHDVAAGEWECICTLKLHRKPVSELFQEYVFYLKRE